jgi:hypothetical protein
METVEGILAKTFGALVTYLTVHTVETPRELFKMLVPKLHRLTRICREGWGRHLYFKKYQDDSAMQPG